MVDELIDSISVHEDLFKIIPNLEIAEIGIFLATDSADTSWRSANITLDPNTLSAIGKLGVTMSIELFEENGSNY